VFLQFRGKLTPTEQLTVVSSRAGLVMDPNSKVTFNGVEIGRVKTISAQMQGRQGSRQADPRRQPPLPSAHSVERAGRYPGHHDLRQ
jgi:phospholipid/cholesterol/gamma-HCH transport system substrate-binding protein